MFARISARCVVTLALATPLALGTVAVATPAQAGPAVGPFGVPASRPGPAPAKPQPGKPAPAQPGQPGQAAPSVQEEILQRATDAGGGMASKTIDHGSQLVGDVLKCGLYIALPHVKCG